MDYFYSGRIDLPSALTVIGLTRPSFLSKTEIYKNSSAVRTEMYDLE